MWFKALPSHRRSQSSGHLLWWTSPDWSTWTITKNKNKDMILKKKWHWARIWPPFIPTPIILRDMWSWNLRYMNWVASIWPRSNPLFLPTLVGLQTTKESMELSKNLRESKTSNFLENTFNGGLDSTVLALARAWSHPKCLQKKD